MTKTPKTEIPARIPTIDQYKQGLQDIECRLSQLQRRLLIEHYKSPDHRCFAKDLAHRCGEKNQGAVNLHYPLAAKKFCKSTNFSPTQGEDGKPRWWAVWSWGQYYPKGRFEWIMHAALAAALEQLGWVDCNVWRSPQEIHDSCNCCEGACRRITVNSYERNAQARTLCIEKYGHRCAVCGIEFGEAYPEVGQGFIEVHHLRPLSQIGREYSIDPLRDLRPVCPNCHAMLHYGDESLSIEGLRSIFNIEAIIRMYRAAEGKQDS